MATDPKLSDTYREITNRLKMFRPGIDLTRYMRGPTPDIRLKDEKRETIEQLRTWGVAAANTTLDGITFVPRYRKEDKGPYDWKHLLTTLRSALTADGDDAFAEGQSPEKGGHWALDASMGQTIGKGFREIWRPTLSSRPLSGNDLPGRHRSAWSTGFGSRFGADPQPLDIRSLHFAVAPDRVNVHIDEVGFVVKDQFGGVFVDPDAGQHIFNELIFKGKLGLPSWITENVDVIAPYSANDFSRAGLSINFVNRRNLRVTVTGTCAVHGDFDCSATAAVSGRF